MNAIIVEKPLPTVTPPSDLRGNDTLGVDDTLRLDHSVEAQPAKRQKPQAPLPSGRRRWIGIVLATLVVGGAAGYGISRLATHPAAGESSEASGSQRTTRASLGFTTATGGDEKSAATARLETVPVEVVQKSSILRLTGTLMADERSSVVANVSGIAAEVRVDRGSMVRKNDVLVQIDPTDAKNKLAEGMAMLEELKARLGIGDSLQSFKAEDQPEVRLAKAAFDLAKSNLLRANDLYGKKVLTSEAYEQTRTEHELALQRYMQALRQIQQAYQALHTAKIRLAMLEKGVADTTIRAPFDGWVVEKLVAVGEQISAGMQATKVMTLVRIDPLRLSLSVPQQSIAAVRMGEKVRFQVDSFPERTFEGTVRFISPVVTSDTRSLVVEALVANPDSTLRPGLFAIAQLELPERRAEIFVPNTAVQKLDEVARVFVVRDGVAREQVVALGEEGRQRVEIRSGLTGKEVLVARPDLVRDGDPVRP